MFNEFKEDIRDLSYSIEYCESELHALVEGLYDIMDGHIYDPEFESGILWRINHGKFMEILEDVERQTHFILVNKTQEDYNWEDLDVVDANLIIKNILRRFTIGVDDTEWDTKKYMAEIESVISCFIYSQADYPIRKITQQDLENVTEILKYLY